MEVVQKDIDTIIYTNLTQGPETKRPLTLCVPVYTLKALEVSIHSS
jgi:hypothetical protein